jgi:anti-sigma B factor antagonist
METTRVKSERVGEVVIASVLCENITPFDSQPLELELTNAGVGCAWKLAVDLAPVQLMGSSGLGLLVSLRKKAKAAGGSCVIFGVNPEIMGMLKVTKLDTLLTIAPDRKSALAAFR